MEPINSLRDRSGNVPWAIMGGNKKASKGNSNDDHKDNKIQAVVLADSFTDTFRPIALRNAQVLSLCVAPRC